MDKLVAPFKILKRDTADKVVLIIEISFIFLLSFSFIYLFDLVLTQIGWYSSLELSQLGPYSYKMIFRFIFIFIGFLFGASLLFGLWMRKTREGWNWSDFGFKREKKDQAIYQGVFLGLLSAGLFIVILFPIDVISNGLQSALENIGYSKDVNLAAEITFNTLYQVLVWSFSAELFFFAYVATSLESKVGKSHARWMSSALIVLYLFLFTYLAWPIEQKDYLGAIPKMWNRFTEESIYREGWLLWLFIIFYLLIHAFLVTKNVLVPIVAHVTVNVVSLIIAIIVTGIRSYNALIPYLVVWILIIGWLIFDRRSKNLIRGAFIEEIEEESEGENERTEIPKVSTNFLTAVGLFLLLVLLAFLTPLAILLALPAAEVGSAEIALVSALDFLLCFTLGLIVLTYRPSRIYDVLLVSEGGMPIAAQREIFDADESMISGFLQALESFSQEIDVFEKSTFDAIRKARYSLIFEEGVLATKLVAVVDYDRSPMRTRIRNQLHAFEKQNRALLEDWTGRQFDEANNFITEIRKIDMRLEISSETKWLAFMSYFFLSFLFLVIYLVTI